jgi:acetyl-CoA carboxylase biotin carboxyl carrier protein
MSDANGSGALGGSGALTDADVEQVARLIESLDRSTFDFLEVQVGELKVTIGRGEPPAQAPPPPAQPPVQAAPVQAAPVQATPVQAAPVQPAPVPVTTAPPQPSRPGLVEITAPTMGIFYAQPEPGKPPFVVVGTVVEETTTVALVEVMKTFHAVSAGVAGTVVEVCVADTELVEFGQVLYRVEPTAP